MKKVLVISSAVIIALVAGCGNSRGRVMPNPDKDNYIRCPICGGTGWIKVKTAVSDKQVTEIDYESGCYQALSCTSCLFFLGWEVAHRDDMEYKNRETDREIRNMENSVYDKQSSVSKRSTLTKTVKCHRCNGVGWITKNKYTIIPGYNEHNLDEIIRANEELNKKN